MNGIIISVKTNKIVNFEYYVNECVNLCKAININIFKDFSQNLDKPDSKFYVGSGKLKEIKDSISDEIDIIIVNDHLSGSVNRNLEKVFEKRVIDRTQLILEIFSKRAKSKEAILQVEIAKLKYQRTRIVGSHANMDRQVSGVGFASRGSGETKLETDRRKIAKQISDYDNELSKFVKTREMQRQKRLNTNIPIVALCGYTNAGKSTLMNTLTQSDKKVFEKDMLFATLDTTVRQITLPNNMKFLLIDTVGFVSNLPHELVNSFQSTLEEIEYANLIIHLCDISNDFYETQEDVVNSTLATLNVDHIDKLTVYNKVDLVSDYSNIHLGISAKQGKNLDELLTKIEQLLFDDYRKVKLQLKIKDNNIINTLSEYTYVTDISYNENSVSFITNLSPSDYKKYHQYIIKEF